jgi:2-methylcitrate dehydratase PrpD
MLVDQIREWGGKAESTIIVYGLKVQAPLAALPNRTIAPAFDLDSVHGKGMAHPNAYMVPAGLAIVEKIGRMIGKECSRPFGFRDFKISKVYTKNRR